MILQIPAPTATQQLFAKLSALGERNRDFALRGIVAAFSLSRDSAPPVLAECERIEVSFDPRNPENRRFLDSLNVGADASAVSDLLSSALRWYLSPR